MKLEIRTADIDDLDILVHYQKQMAMETENLKLEHDMIYNGIKNGLLDRNKAIYFLASLEGNVVGTLMITKEWSDWRNAWVLWIQSVYVAKEHRGKRIYSVLYQHIKNIVAKEKTYSGIRLYVDIRNTNAQNVYSKLGMNGDHYKLFEYFDESN